MGTRWKRTNQSEYRLQDLVHLLTESVKWGKADAIQELKARNALLVARMDVSGTQGLVQGVQSSEALPAPEADSRPPEQNDVGANADAAVTDEAREETIAVDVPELLIGGDVAEGVD